MLQLDPRKRAVLRAVVEEHIRSAEPVGSEHAVLRNRLRVSPATIRSTMAGLEQVGLLTHPHTSAGRVPTDLGYRIYVDMLLEAEPLPPAERQAVRRHLGGAEEPVDLTDQAVRVLASLTRYASVIAGPSLPEQRFRALHLVPMDEGRALAVVTTASGGIQSRAIAVPAGIDATDLEQIARTITQRLQGIRVGDLTHERLEEVVGEASRHHQVLEALKAWILRNLQRSGPRRLHVEGVRHLLREPEFSRPEAATRVLQALEEQAVLAEAVAAGPDEGLWISIGAENRPEELRACSLVFATYAAGGQTVGVVGLVGPTRMRYSRAVSAVRYVAGRLGEALGRSA